MPDRGVSFRLCGTGVALPRRVVPSGEIDALIGWPQGQVEATFCIAERRWAGPDETSSALGAAAATQALADAGWSGSDLDVIIGACGVMEQPIPGTAALIQARLGLGDSGIPAFDVNATCLSFLTALDIALLGFAAGRWRRALIVSADIASAALDFSTPEASAIFGDGAAAVALEAGGPHRMLGVHAVTYGSGAGLCRLDAGGTRLRPHEDLAAFLAASKLRMNGTSLFKAVALRFPDFLAALLGKAAVASTALDCVIPHQASAGALEHLRRLLPVERDRTVDIFGTHGNQIATSLPHALHVARQQRRLQDGSVTLLIGSSAGISLGGAVIRW